MHNYMYVVYPIYIFCVKTLEILLKKLLFFVLVSLCSASVLFFSTYHLSAIVFCFSENVSAQPQKLLFLYC